MTSDRESESSSAITVVTATPSAATTSALKGMRDGSFPTNLSSYAAGALEVAENQVGTSSPQQFVHLDSTWDTTEPEKKSLYVVGRVRQAS